MQIKFEVIEGPEAGKEFVFQHPGTFIIGRGKDANFCLTGDPHVSRFHCRIEIAPPRCYLVDLGSMNGTWVNNLVVDEEELHDGEIVRVGFTRMKVHIDKSVFTTEKACIQCGKMVQITDGEEGSVLCNECFEKNRAKRHKMERRSKQLIPACYRCGKQIKIKSSESSTIGPPRPTDVFCCPDCLPDRELSDKVAQFPLIKRLGKGGMGDIFLAYEEETSRLLAIKKIKGLSRELISRFLRSCRLLEEVDHPNIIKVYGQDSIENMPYMFMEYAPLGSLGDFILRWGGPLPPSEAVRIAIGVLVGLGYLHSRKIIHRDIKPPNIILRCPGKREHGIDALGSPFDFVPKITDFELVKYFSASGGITGTGIAMGTYIYAPKELIKDAKRVTVTVDIYSVGVMLYYMLSGKYPFHFPSPLEVKRFQEENRGRFQNLNEALEMYIKEKRCMHPKVIPFYELPEPLEKKSGGTLPSALCQAVNKAIQPESKNRFQTAEQFIQALRSVDV